MAPSSLIVVVVVASAVAAAVSGVEDGRRLRRSVDVDPSICQNLPTWR